MGALTGPLVICVAWMGMMGMVEAAVLAFVQPAAVIPRRASATAAHKHRKITSAAPALRMTQTPPPAKPGFVVRLRHTALPPFISVCARARARARACAYARACQVPTSGAMLNKPNNDRARTPSCGRSR